MVMRNKLPLPPLRVRQRHHGHLCLEYPGNFIQNEFSSKLIYWSIPLTRDYFLTIEYLHKGTFPSVEAFKIF
jgi:hypothetical protein